MVGESFTASFTVEGERVSVASKPKGPSGHVNIVRDREVKVRGNTWLLKPEKRSFS